MSNSTGNKFNVEVGQESGDVFATVDGYDFGLTVSDARVLAEHLIAAVVAAEAEDRA